MSQFLGEVAVGARRYAVEVTADSSRLSIVVDGAKVYYKRFFVNAGSREAPIKIGGRQALLRWEMVGASRGECSVTLDGKTVQLAQRMKGGDIKAPLSALERMVIQIRIFGAVMMVLALFWFFVNWGELRQHHRYYLSLGMTPWFFIAGIISFVRPSAFTSQKPPQRFILIACLLSAAVLSVLFTRWIIHAVLGPGWEPAGWF